MASGNEELEQFKTNIDIREVAENYGFLIDLKESSSNNSVMRLGEIDKIHIVKKSNGHYVYVSHKGNHQGSVIDFVKHHENCTLGYARKHLRPFMNSGAYQNKGSYIPLKAIKRDIEKVVNKYHSFTTITDFSLFETRNISKQIVTNERFIEKMKCDEFGMPAFPHYYENGLCGFSRSNHKFSAGGQKTLWISQCYKKDTRIVFTESPIEALCHYVIFKNDTYRYVSFCGSWSDEATKYALFVTDKFKGNDIELAFNHDDSGKSQADKMKTALNMSGKNILINLPELEDYDWSDTLNDIISNNGSP